MTYQFDPKFVSKNYAINSIKKLKTSRGKKLLSVFSLIPLAACGGGGTEGVQAPAQAAPPPSPDFDETSTNVFVAIDNDNSTLDQSEATAGLTVTSKNGNDTITTGSGNDIIRAGQGADNVNAGAGDDIIVVVGQTGVGEYTQSSIINPAGTGFDLSSVLSLVDLNDQSVSEAAPGEIIDGGGGADVLVIYGTVDLSGVTVANISTLWVNSDVTLSPAQLANLASIQGDGSSVIRISGQNVDVSGTSFSNIGSLVLDNGATLSLSSSSDVAGISQITASGGSFGLSISSDGAQTTVLVSELGSAISAATTINVEAGAVLVVDDLAVLQNGGIQSITGAGEIRIDESKVNMADAIQGLQSSGLDPVLSLTDSSGSAIQDTSTVDDSGTIVGSSASDFVILQSGDNNVSTGAGSDVIVTSSGSDLIMAGEGADQISAGDGDDTIVLVGTTVAGEYTEADILNSAGSGVDVSGVLDASTLNGKTSSDAVAGETIDGGGGNDTLVIYGTMDLTGVEITSLNRFIVNSDVRVTFEQFNGFHAVKGDGASIVRITGGTTITVIDSEGSSTATHENRGHGNNTDGQDDNNPGQGSGGPNFREKDGVDEDEKDHGSEHEREHAEEPEDDHDNDHPGRSTVVGEDGTTTITEIATIDLDWTRTADIGTLSLENEIIVLANGMEDFAGISEIVSDGNATLRITNENIDVPMELDLRLLNISGFAVLDLHGDFNITADDATDFTGFGEIEVSASDVINLNFVSDALGGAVKDFDLTLSSFDGVDNITTDGNVRLIFKDLAQLKDAGVGSLAGSGETLVLVFTGSPDLPTEILVSELSGLVSGVTAIELGTNVTIVNDDQATMDLLLANVDIEIVMTTSGDDTINASDSRDHYTFDVAAGWGHDTITGFDDGDTLNFVNSGLSFGDIVLQYTSTGVLVTNGTDSIFLDGFEGVLKNTGSYSFPILTPVPEAERVDNDGIKIDVRPPSYEGLEFSSDIVTLHNDEHLYIKVLTDDDLSGAEYVQLSFRGPDGQEHWAYLHDGTDFNFKFDVNDHLPEGTYELIYVRGQDYAGNDFSYNEAQLETLGLAQTFEIINNDSDLEAPVLSAVSITAPTIDVSVNNDPVFVKIAGTDDKAGVSHAWVTFTGPSGGTQTFYVYDDQDMTIELDMGEFAENGTWTLTRVQIYDNRNLGTVYEADQLNSLGISGSFDVVNSNFDNTPMVLAGVSLSADTYFRNENQDMVVTVDATDDISGPRQLTLRFEGPEGTSVYKTISFNNGNQGIIEVGDFAPPGTYTLVEAWGYDVASNWVRYSAQDLTDAGINLSFELVGKAAVSIESTVGNDLLIGGDGVDFFVFDLNWGQDEVSDFIVGEDRIDITDTGLQFADLTQTLTADGLVLQNGDNSILIRGLSAPLGEGDFAVWRGNDTTAPVLLGVSFESPTFDATSASRFLVSVEVVDENSGFNQARIEFTAPDGTIISDTAWFGNNSTIGFSSQLLDQVGTYTLSSVTVWDNQFNSFRYNADDLAALGLATSFDVTDAPPEDNTAPVLSGVTLSATTYEAGDSEGIIIHADAVDDLSGINYSYLVFEDLDGLREYYWVNQSGDLNHEFTTNKWAAPGSYTLVEVRLTDDAGNEVNYNADDLVALGINASFSVTNTGQVDVTGPTTDGTITLSSPWIAFGDPQAVNITVAFTDDVSGPAWGFAYYDGPDGNTVEANFSNMLPGSGIGEFRVDEFDNAGTYTLSYLVLYDMAGNSTTFNADDLALAGITHSIRVLNEGPQEGLVVIGTDEAETITSTSDDEIFTLHRGNDVLVFEADFGADTVMDFTQGEDILDFSGAGIVEGGLDFTQTEFGLIIEDDFGNTILLKGFEGALTSADVEYAA